MVRWRGVLGGVLSGLFGLAGGPVHAADAWQACVALADEGHRLACFDRWAAAQAGQTAQTDPTDSTDSTNQTAQPEVAQVVPTPAPAWPVEGAAGSVASAPAAALPAATPEPVQVVIASQDGCRNPAFERTTRFWELTRDTDCGTFRFRGYRPLMIGAAWGSSINRQPFSSTQGLAPWRDYQRQELRLQLSVRTKLASNLLTFNHPSKRDSLWFGYTLGANWQAFNSALSRPFRNTDHEPELMYVYPLEWSLPAGVQLRYAGLGINHQSNGQSDPLSRSWNRYYVMLGADLTARWSLQARWWKRQREELSRDNNPEISDTVGRLELTNIWDLDPRNSLMLTLRHNLHRSARGSARLEWSRALGEGFAGGQSNLRLVTGVFHGYGDSLIDYNRRRTVLSVGLSLLDF